MHNGLGVAPGRVAAAAAQMQLVGGPVALQELAVRATCRHLGMEPHEFAPRTVGRTLRWSAAGTPLGQVVAVASPAGRCAVRIGELHDLVEQVRVEFAGPGLRRDDAMRDAMSALQRPAKGLDAQRLPVAAAGTALQSIVWDALREIPAGRMRTHLQVAASIGSPQSVRAAACACAANPVVPVVPCHRVIHADGNAAGSRWGLPVKTSLLDAGRAAARP